MIKAKFASLGVALVLSAALLTTASQNTEAQTLNSSNNIVSYTVTKDVMVPMRDGVRLATDIYSLPERAGKPNEVLLARTPYGKDLRVLAELRAFIEAGYTVVIQDVRGRFNSEGDFLPHAQETNDGVDTYEWIVRQPWCNGTIGTFGGSYLGGTQWIPMRTNPSAVKAMIPQVTFSDMFNTNVYNNGVKVLHDLVWAAGNIGPARMNVLRSQGVDVPEEAPDVQQVLNELPLAKNEVVRKYTPFYMEWLKHDTDDEYWRGMSPNSGYQNITIPALNISGWYDIFTQATFDNFTNMRERGGSEVARKYQKIIIGPWTHSDFSGKFEERDFGSGSSADDINLNGIKVRWMDHWLRGVDNGIEREDPIMIFTMGTDQWQTAKEWPLPETKFTPYYLHSTQGANSSAGDGVLSTAKPTRREAASDTYVYDPLNPTPTHGGGVILPGTNSSGPKDQREVERRNDVLVFTTPVLDKPVEVTGQIEAHFYVSSDCPDTDFTAKLVDVYPDGRCMQLTAGIIRARYRNGFEKGELMEQGKVYEVTVKVPPTSNVFLEGHQIRLEVASCNFPQYARNSNSGKSLSEETTEDYRPATNTIWHNAKYPSYLLLPIIN